MLIFRCTLSRHWCFLSFFLSFFSLVCVAAGTPQVSDAEFKEDLTARICQVVEKFSPDTMWRVDTTISVLSGVRFLSLFFRSS